MSIRKKGRRRLTKNGKDYIWYVRRGDENPYLILHIVSEDKRLKLVCPLGMEPAYILVLPGFFQGAEYRINARFLPPLPVPENVTPGFVSALIDWAENGSGAEPALHTGDWPDL